jgi:hypothetical protein
LEKTRVALDLERCSLMQRDTRIGELKTALVRPRSSDRAPRTCGDNTEAVNGGGISGHPLGLLNEPQSLRAAQH